MKDKYDFSKAERGKFYRPDAVLQLPDHMVLSIDHTTQISNMQSNILAAVEANHIVDISTTGRKSGKVHRHEIWLHTADGQFYLTGKPAPRDWYANLLAHPDMTVHLKQDLVQDVPACATPVTDSSERRILLTKLLHDTPYLENLEAWVAGSPLVRVSVQTPV